MSRIPLSKHKPWPKKIYKYYVVNSLGQDVEGDLPGVDHAHTVIDYWAAQGVTDLTIEVEHCPKQKGLGRDPDLH
jgi:hypothetical protein